MAGKIRILLVDDQPIFSEGLRAILESEQDFVVENSASTAGALRKLRAQPTDVAILDVDMPGVDALLPLLKATFPRLRVLALSEAHEQHHALRALKDGADGLLSKRSSPEHVISAVRSLGKGEHWVSPDTGYQVIHALIGSTTDGLSTREFAILRLIADGQSLVSIARELHLSPKTVTTYRARILRKLGVQSNAALTRYAIEKGILQPH